jgi:hypothetical protein
VDRAGTIALLAFLIIHGSGLYVSFFYHKYIDIYVIVLCETVLTFEVSSRFMV